MRIIKERTEEEVVARYLQFEWNDDKGGGFGFPCDAKGNVLPEVCTEALSNYAKCLDGTYNVTRKGIRTECWTVVNPTIGECVCGNQVVLDDFTCTCDGCGRDYNWNGDLLASREQWGEETGESLSDILSIH